MGLYIVIRHGSNAANQPMTQEMVVGSVEARGPAHALQVARERFDCYHNQHLSVGLHRKATRAQKDALAERERLDALAE